MYPRDKSEKGQALVLIALALVALFGLVGLAVDGGMTYSERRQSQNAADAASLFAARTYAESLSATTGATQDQVRAHTATNGFVNDGTNTIVTLTTQPAIKKCPDSRNPTGDGIDFTVTIQSTIQTTFARVIGIDQVKNTNSATARGCKSMWVPLFLGSAVVGLDPFSTSFNSGSSNAVHWDLTGGGIFSNNNAYTKNAGSITFNTTGTCLTAVGTASGGWSCTPSVNNLALQIPYTYNYMRKQVNYPTCPAAAQAVVSGGQIHEALGYEGQGTNVNTGWEGNYAPGVYCINGVTGNIHGPITGTGVTFYLRDPINVKFNGGGFIGATAPIGGRYDGELIIGDPLGAAHPDDVIPPGTPCTESFEFRGNGSIINTGTIYLPAACIDYRGNSTGDLQRTQLIGYDVTSNGDGQVAVNYSNTDNHENPSQPTLQLVR